MYYLKKIPFSVDVIYTKVVTDIKYSEGMIRMEVIFAGIFLVIVGIFVCCLNYSIENKIVEKETEKNKKIVSFRAHRFKLRFMKKRSKVRKSRKASQYNRIANSY